MAETVAAGSFVQPTPLLSFAQSPGYETLPTFCRVAATVTPVPDSEIKFEVWLPIESWNGKFMGTGNGQARGTIFYWNMVDPLRRGYAVANTDRGHEGDGSDWSFANGHPEKLIDYTYRAAHEMTANPKRSSKLITAKRRDTPIGPAAPPAGNKALLKLSAFRKSMTASSPEPAVATGRR